jgi:carbon-monoxide dehydrogenase small subunit
MGAKSGCRAGYCGLCSVMLNGSVVSACLIPAFRVRGCEVITIEGFSQTDEYGDIAAGFAQVPVRLCGQCDTAKLFATESLLEKNGEPSREVIFAAFAGVQCRCTEPESLAAGVLAAADIRRRRRYGRNA